MPHAITTTEPDPIEHPGVVEHTCTCGEQMAGPWSLTSDWADLHRLFAAPEPTLGCPAWCSLPSGHGWDTPTDDGVARTHTVGLYRGVTVERFDELDAHTGREEAGAPALRVDVEDVTGDQVAAVVAAVAAAGRLIEQDRQ